MNRLQHMLNKLGDEGLEVAQIALKTQLFGPDEVMPGQPLSNFERCHYELDDLYAVVEMLNAECGFGYAPNRDRIEAKKLKVTRYMEFSMARGMTDGTASNTSHPMSGDE